MRRELGWKIEKQVAALRHAIEEDRECTETILIFAVNIAMPPLLYANQADGVMSLITLTDRLFVIWR